MLLAGSICSAVTLALLVSFVGVIFAPAPGIAAIVLGLVGFRRQRRRRLPVSTSVYIVLIGVLSALAWIGFFLHFVWARPLY